MCSFINWFHNHSWVKYSVTRLVRTRPFIAATGDYVCLLKTPVTNLLFNDFFVIYVPQLQLRAVLYYLLPVKQKWTNS